MSYFVSTETAIRLRDAGFPEPEFQFGQLWETENGRDSAFVGTLSFHLLKQYHLKEIVFRPTATDILAELGSTYKLGLALDGLWWCNNEGDFSKNEWLGNPAEAAALAWLKIHENKQP